MGRATGPAAKGLVVNKPGNGGVLSAGRALPVAAQFEFPEFEVQGVEHQQAVQKREALAEEEFEDLGSLDKADDAGQDAQHAGLGATGNQPRGRGFWKKTAIARSAQVRRKDAGLPFKAEDGPVHVGFPEQHTGIVGQVAGREVVTAIGHDVVGPNDAEGILAGQARRVQRDLDVRIDAGEGVPSRFGLGPADVPGAMNDLALQVREVHHIEIHQAEFADARRRQVEGNWRAEAAGPDAEHAGRANFLLALEADLGQNEVARITAEFVFVEFHNQFGTCQANTAKTIGQAAAQGNGQAETTSGPAKDRGEAPEIIGSPADAGDSSGQRLSGCR